MVVNLYATKCLHPAQITTGVLTDATVRMLHCFPARVKGYFLQRFGAPSAAVT